MYVSFACAYACVCECANVNRVPVSVCGLCACACARVVCVCVCVCARQFPLHAGYMAWADARDTVVLFPQVCARRGFFFF